MFGIDDAIGAALKVLDKFVPDPAAKQQAEADLRSSLQQWDQNQTEINKVEAGNDNLFVSGWRPAIGWILAAALLYTYILVPFTVWTFAFVLGQPVPKFPVLDDNLWELMFCLLGMGGLRTYEKFKGVSK
jgi:hypothetical protein